MAEQVFKSPGVTTREIDLSGPGATSPQGVPAGVIGTAMRGPAFVPATFASYKDFIKKFGGTDGKLFGPLAISEWLRTARAGTFLRVLGIGDGKKRNSDGDITNAGFTVGQELIQNDGTVKPNPYATGGLSAANYALGSETSPVPAYGVLSPGTGSPGGSTNGIVVKNNPTSGTPFMSSTTDGAVDATMTITIPANSSSTGASQTISIKFLAFDGSAADAITAGGHSAANNTTAYIAAAGLGTAAAVQALIKDVINGTSLGSTARISRVGSGILSAGTGLSADLVASDSNVTTGGDYSSATQGLVLTAANYGDMFTVQFAQSGGNVSQIAPKGASTQTATASATVGENTITFTGIPNEGSSFTITDSSGANHTYTFGDPQGIATISIAGASTAAEVAAAVGNYLANDGAAGTTYEAIKTSNTGGATWAGDTFRVKVNGAVVGIATGLFPTGTGYQLAEAEITEAATLGRTYFLSAVMEDQGSSGYLFDAGLSKANNPILRGVLMVPSGVAPALSGWGGSRLDSASTYAFDDFGAAQDAGHQVGAVDMRANGDRQFVMFLNGFTNTSVYPAIITASLNPTSKNYFSKVLNTDPTKIEETGHYLYSYFDIDTSIADIAAEDSGSDTSAEQQADVLHRLLLQTGSHTRNTYHTAQYKPNYEGFADRFQHAVSPFVISQTLGDSPLNLFRFHALDAGAVGNTLFKISIANIKKSTDPVSDYGNFDVYVRDFHDSDEEPIYLEKYLSVDLNPQSDRYIARVIGTQNVYFDFDKQIANQKIVVDGLYPNKSGYIRVEVVDDIQDGALEPTALPLGFRGKKHLTLDGTLALSALDVSTLTGIDELALDDGVVEPPVPFRKNVKRGSGNTARVDSRLFWGVQNTKQTSVTERNGSTVKDHLINNFTKYFPSYGTYPAFIGNNEGTAAANGAIYDADVYNNNLFSLERVLVKCKGSSTANAVDPREWDEATYIRSGSVPVSGAGCELQNDGVTEKTAANGFRFLDVEKDFSQQASKRYLKFTFFMQGGFDGLNIFRTDEYELNNAAAHREIENAASTGGPSSSTVSAYRKGIDIMAEKSNIDIQIFAIPGIREPAVTDYAIDATEDRFDAWYVMDIQECEHAGTLDSNVLTGSVQEISVTNTAQKLQDRELDTSFAAAYFPDVVMTDPDTGANVRVPPSVSVLGALSFNDSVAHPWYAPAGFNRGALPTAVESQVKLSKNNMDTLYEVDINPITSFPTSEGVVIFGQKTLLQAQSSIDRVNVRRLLIDIRRKVKTVSRSILFEPNRAATLSRFSSAVQPILTTIQAQQGLDRFKVVIDTTTTTQQDIENNTIRGKIFLQPTKAIEFISLDFVITNAGAEI